MGLLDRFMDIMKLNDDEDYDDDFFDDEYDDYGYEEKPKRNLFRKETPVYNDDDDFDDGYNPPAKTSRNSRSNNSKVTPMRQPARRASVSMEVCVIKPTSVEDAREITETLLDGRTVILNLEGLDLEIAQRIIDFTSGATYAISGNLQKISNYIFLVTPTNVDISGDLQDLLNTSFDASSMRSRF
ncbi:cell division protein SepF [Lachnospiraceae bacterium 48-42]